MLYRFLPLSVYSMNCLWEQVTDSQQKKQLSITPWFHLSLTLGDVDWNRKQDGLLSKTGEICPTKLHFIPASVTETLINKAEKLLNYFLRCLLIMSFSLNAWLATLLWGQSWLFTGETKVSKSYAFNLKIANSKHSDKKKKNQAPDTLK